MASRLCQACRDIFLGPQSLRETQSHHQSRDALYAAAAFCYICRHVSEDFVRSGAPAAQDGSIVLEACLTPLAGFPTNWMKLSIELTSSDPPENSAEDADVQSDQDDCGSIDSGGLMVDDSSCDAWGFLVQPAEDVSVNIGDWSVPAGLYNDELFGLASSWLQQCRSHHTECASGVSAFQPTRLLDIHDLARGKVRLTITADARLPSGYATVSHCWGRAKTLKLLSTNLDDLSKDIAVEDLPTSYKEALIVASRLSIRYLWIDALCIMQDSKEDWLREANMMGDVYRHSQLNIALAGAADTSGVSFTERNPETIRPAYIEAHWDGLLQQGFYIVREDIWDLDVTSSKLGTRAWVLQEVQLAPRVLYLGKSQMWFHCIEGLACETYPGWDPMKRLNITGTDSLLSNAPSRGRLDPHVEWETIVERYARCDLTVLSDRMIAIAGVASFHHGHLNDQYIAGLWRSQLPAELMWRTTKLKKSFRPTEYRAPSWSWFSVEGPVEFLHRPDFTEAGSMMNLCTVESVHVEPLDSSRSFGILQGGAVELQCALIPVLLWYGGRDRVAICDEESRVATGVETSQAVYDYFEGRSGAVDWEGDECTADCLPVAFESTYSHGEGKDIEDIYPDRVTPDVNGAFFVPIITYLQGGSPRCRGLILQKVGDQAHTFKRIGHFEATGKDECACFLAEATSLVRIV